jgi:hypothetical protein
MPSKKDIGQMLRRKGVIFTKEEGGFVEFDFSRIENEKAIYGLSGYLLRKMPHLHYDMVVGFLSDNSSLSRVITEQIKPKRHCFVSQDDNVSVALEKFKTTKKINILLVKALIKDGEIDEWDNFYQLNESIQKISVVAIADGRSFPYENSLEVFSLIDRDQIHI